MYPKGSLSVSETVRPADWWVRRILTKSRTRQNRFVGSPERSGGSRERFPPVSHFPRPERWAASANCRIRAPDLRAVWMLRSQFFLVLARLASVAASGWARSLRSGSRRS